MEESEDTNPVNKHPSLPPNYVTLSMLKERWLQRKQEEEEGKLKQQQNLQHGAKEEIASGSKDGISPTIRNQNRGKSGPAYVPRRRQQSEKDRRGGESWVKKHEEPESSGSVVIGGNQEIKEKKHWERRKPRALQNVKSPENVAKKEEIPTGVSEESGGKGKICGELQLDGDNGGVSVSMVEVVSENGVERDTRKGFGGERRGGKKWGGRFKRNENRRMNSNVKPVGELGENEKKAEEGVVVVAEDRREKGEKGRQSGIGQSSVKIDKSSQDLLLDDRKDGNVRMRVSGQQQSMNSKVHKQVGEFGVEEKKVEERVVGVAEDRREKGEKGKQSGIGQSSVKTDKSFQDMLLDDRKDGNVRMRVSSQQQSMDSKVHKQVGELGENEKKAEERVVGVAEDRREKGEKGRQSGIGQSSVKIDKSSQDLLLDDRKDGNVRMGVSGQQENMNSKVHKQVGEYGDEEKKVEEGVVIVANDGRKNGEEGRIRTGTGPWAKNIETRFRNLSLDNRKYDNVRMRISGSAGGRRGYVGYRRVARERVEQVENRLMWVKKGENSSGNVTESNSQGT